MKKTFYSHGKLLLTGEYVILDGAKGLAIPTKKGQSLIVTTNTSGKIEWKSYNYYGNIWYKTEVEISELLKLNPPKGNSEFDKKLFKILWEAQQLNPEFLTVENGFIVETHLEFERLWGLGTSSTLINNIAKWARVNPFELLNKSFGGSGYDIAAAEAEQPIFYQRTVDENKPLITEANFDPPFKEHLFFVYLKEKKDSKEAIKNYRSQSKENLQSVISTINQLTDEISACNDIKIFENLLNEHEKVIASILKNKPIKQQRFPDFSGTVKSLGGWGGDFVLATGTKDQMNYFYRKGYKTIIPYTNIIL